MRALHLNAVVFTLVCSPLTSQFGGNGSDGVFAPKSDTTLASRTYNFQSITIPRGVKVTLTGTLPAILYSRGDIRIHGTLDASARGSTGGPGGFNGGQSLVMAPRPFDWVTYYAGKGGGPGGGYAGAVNGVLGPYYSPGGPGAHAKSYGTQQPFDLRGGSGGGGGASMQGFIPGGEGGGGTIVLSSSAEVIISGEIRANGSGFGSKPNYGAGGAIFVRGIRKVIVAPTAVLSAVPDGRVRVTSYRDESAIHPSATISPKPHVTRMPILSVEVEPPSTNLSFVKLPEATSSFGIIGDVDKDGLPDVALGFPNVGTKRQGKVRVVSGRTGKTIFEIIGQVEQEAFGARIAFATDVNRDGYPDIVTSGANFNSYEPGLVRVISGKDGKFIHTLKQPGINQYLGLSISWAGDNNKDGYRDIMVSVPKGNRWDGTVHIYSGKDATLLREFKGSDREELGRSAQCIGDINGDRYVDFVASGNPEKIGSIRRPGRVKVFSGKDGKILYTFVGTRENQQLGWRLAGIGDANRDGVPDFVLGEGAPANGVQVISGKTGKTIVSFTTGRDYVWDIAPAGDMDGDGGADLLIGDFIDKTAGFLRGSIVAYSGATGKQLFEVRGQNDKDWLGEGVAGGFDLNGDGAPDFIGSSRAGGGEVTFYHGLKKRPLADFNITTDGFPGGTVMLFGSLGTANIPVPGVGTIGIDPASYFHVLDLKLPLVGLEAMSTTRLLVPDHPAITGRTFYFQGLHLAPLGNVHGDALTDTAAWTAVRM